MNSIEKGLQKPEKGLLPVLWILLKTDVCAFLYMWLVYNWTPKKNHHSEQWKRKCAGPTLSLAENKISSVQRVRLSGMSEQRKEIRQAEDPLVKLAHPVDVLE